jgi:tripartite-type tricarboxylate transporter receptor subunit TctC
VTPIAVSSIRRIDSLPKLPTIAESGISELKGFEATQWYGVVAKAGTTKGDYSDLKQRGYGHPFDFCSGCEMKSKNLRQMLKLDRPEEFAAFLRTEIDRWSKVVKAAGITPS